MNTLYRLFFLAPLLLLLVGCGPLRVEGELVETADATATAGTRATEVASIPTPTPEPVAMQGVVWHDRCTLDGGEGGEPVVPSPDCVNTEAGWYRANSVRELGEEGIEGGGGRAG